MLAAAATIICIVLVMVIHGLPEKHREKSARSQPQTPELISSNLAPKTSISSIPPAAQPVTPSTPPPPAPLPPVTAPPAVATASPSPSNFIDKMLRNREPSQSSSVIVNTEPPGAQVTLDDSTPLHSPARYDNLTPGSHRLVIALAGCISQERSFSLDPGQVLEFPLIHLDHVRVAPTVTQEQLRAFCQKLQSDEQSHDINRILANYDSKVDYIDQGKVGPAAIRADKEKYFQRWPQTSYLLKGDITILESHESRWKVRFQIDFSAANAAGEHVTGVAEQTMDLALLDGALKVTGEKSRVLSRNKANDPAIPPAPGAVVINSLGFPDGTYSMPPKTDAGDAASIVESNEFIVHGSTFEWVKKQVLTPTALGLSIGRYPASYTGGMSGSISRGSKGTLLFTPKDAHITNRSPPNGSDSWIPLPTWKQMVKSGKPFVLKYESGRLVETGTGHVWTRN
jgi:hypothetical protein